MHLFLLGSRHRVQCFVLFFFHVKLNCLDKCLERSNPFDRNKTKSHDKEKSKKNWEMALPEEVYVYITSSKRPLTNC